MRLVFATDSLVCARKIPSLDHLDLRKMKLDKSGYDAYFFSNGFYQFNRKWKKRGLDKLNGKDIEHVTLAVEEFSKAIWLSKYFEKDTSNPKKIDYFAYF